MPNPSVLHAQKIASRLFNRWMLRRKRAYVGLFGGADGVPAGDAAIVLADLREFCRGMKSSFDSDTHVTALLEGRREVWLRIMGYLHLTEAEMIRLDPISPEDMGDDDE